MCGEFETANRREWLVTNGLGGYASGTVDGSLARSYHGYLVAALTPPAARTLVFTKCDEICSYAGRETELATNRWGSGAVAPRGYLALERFYLDGTTPVWEFAFAGALVEKRVSLAVGRNVALVRYRVLRAAEPVAFSVRAFAHWRDHGAAGSLPQAPRAASRDGAVVVSFGSEDRALFFRSDRCVPEPALEWYHDYALERERERGLPDRDDALHAATFTFSLQTGECALVWAGLDDVTDMEAARSWDGRASHERDLLDRARARTGAHAQLVLAADQFVAERRVNGNPGTTVIAGYPWFTDWGRDTAIALPGLALATGRPEIARDILLTFARYVDGGMLPNVFPDVGDVPQYNTVDAALWYVEAVRAYVAQCGIDAAFEPLYAACIAIVAGYRRGTRYGIGMDSADALIRAGEPGVALTWMDAKYGDVVVTPRIGKPVEINALWYGALRTLADLTRRRGSSDTEYDALAERVRTSFRRYVLPGGALADVLDGPAGDDRTLRPNAIFAVALEHAPLDGDAARGVVASCAREFLTSHGLRTLARSDAAYVGEYDGPRERRDGAYHQGTVWPWLLGPFACAYARVTGDRAAARALLDPLVRALGSYGLGSLGEITDGDAPHRWKGAVAQAWSVGETLRALHALADERPRLGLDCETHRGHSSA